MKYPGCFLILLLSLSLVSAKPLAKEYKIGEVIELSGTIKSGTYLSRWDGSDMEYHNEAILLILEEEIRIKDLNEQVSTIEIGNFYLFYGNDTDTDEFYGKKVKIKGKLGLVHASGNGYYRQIFSKVDMEIISVELLE